VKRSKTRKRALIAIRVVVSAEKAAEQQRYARARADDRKRKRG
jgi:hypothetical protein